MARYHMIVNSGTLLYIEDQIVPVLAENCIREKYLLTLV